MSPILNTLISDLQQGSIISFAAWILLGGLIGIIGSNIVNKTGHGALRDVLLSIIGAIFGGFLANLLNEKHTAGLDRYSLLVAGVGALVFLITYQGMFRRRHSSRTSNRRFNDPIDEEDKTNTRSSERALTDRRS